MKTFQYLYENLKDDDLALFKFATGYGLTELVHESKNFVMCYYKNKPKFEPKLCIIGLHKEDDTDYINLKFMKMICKLGYDGIRMPSKYVFQIVRTKLQFGEFIYKLIKKHPEYRYNEDIFLCDSNKNLDLIQSYTFEKAPICKNLQPILEP
jgi:hypothetical protein